MFGKAKEHSNVDDVIRAAQLKCISGTTAYDDAFAARRPHKCCMQQEPTLRSTVNYTSSEGMHVDQ